MKYKLSELVENSILEKLLSSLSSMTGITASIIDIADDLCITSTHQDICKNFHRVNPETSKHCSEAFSCFKSCSEEKKFFKHKCGNDLENLAFPIIIENDHIATLVLEQFFYDTEMPGEDSFTEKAYKFGFDHDKYIESYRKVPVRSEKKIEAIMCFFSNFIKIITECGASRLRQLEFESKYFGLLESLQAGILIINSDNCIFMVNQTIAESLGYSIGELQGMNILHLMPQKTKRRFLKALESSVNGSKKSLDAELVKKDGTLAGGLLSVINFPGSAGETAGHLLGFTDLTERMALEDDLKKAKENAERADMAKSVFLASMSHEIRTPLNSIIGFSGLLSNTSISENQKDMVNCIVTSGRHLLSIINDVLDISKIESGALELEESEFDIETAISEVIEINKVQYENKNIDLKYSFDKKPENLILSDPGRLKQILINLTANALKFTASGCVNIRCEIIDSEKHHVRIRFSVSDTGAGIPEIDREKIFKPFIQGEEGGRNKYGGTGLGLSISNHLVRMMGGDGIFLESIVGAGSKFHFTLSFKKGASIQKNPPEEQPAGQDETKERTLDILIVEDNLLNMHLLKMLLEGYDHRVTAAENGKIALDILRYKKFDIIFMDIQMPVMDGIQATKNARIAGISTPIIAMTANALKSDLEECLNSGMNAYITKPFDAEELEDAIAKYVFHLNGAQDMLHGK